ncbi:MAG: ATP synthase F1 subunit gamma [Bdellovibrionota bacterium]|nr:ATP synthase F1 subunit gamma [Deltaproteobacteria bacterium]
MANLRDIRNRIKSVKSTEKITRAMKMVAAAKLRRAQEAATGSTPYQKKIDALLRELSQTVTGDVHPFLHQSDVKKRLLVIFSSDRGLCGGFNNNLFKQVHKNLRDSPVETDVVLIGKKAHGQFANKKYHVEIKVEDFWLQFDHPHAKKLFDQIGRLFLENKYQQVDIAYNDFVSVMSQVPSIKTLLPMTKAETKTAQASQASPYKNYHFKPSEKAILQSLIPKALMSTFYGACLHSLAGEYGARMTSMDSASRNAGDMIDSLTLKMNRVRQAAITSELVEIISGAEAIS